MRCFSDSFPELRTFKGYRLIGVDGSAVNIPLNKSEPETLHQNKENHKCFSQCYFNGAYDLLNAIYVDAVISTLQKTDERSALLAMSHRSSIPGNSVFVADRGYGGWKMFAGLDRPAGNSRSGKRTRTARAFSEAWICQKMRNSISSGLLFLQTSRQRKP